MRMLALAQAWRRAGGTAVFLCAEIPDALAQRIRGEGFDVQLLGSVSDQYADARATLAAVQSRGTGCGMRDAGSDVRPPAAGIRPRTSALRLPTSDCWVAADGYHFGSAFQREIKAAGLRLLVMDDNGENGEYEADVILNQNIHADPSMYARRNDAARLLLGTRFALIREEFLRLRDVPREMPAVARKVLVTMGGADPDNVTAKVIAALAGQDVDVVVVVGSSNPNLDALRAGLADLRRPTSAVRLVVNATNMPELMAWADLAITAGGSTCWEMCLAGLPMAAIVIAANQRLLVRALGAAGVALDAGDAAALDAGALAARIAELLPDAAGRGARSRAARILVDGWGGDRVVARLAGGGLLLRAARREDAMALWTWANDPETRAASFCPDPIPLATHLAWLQSKLADDRTAILVAEDEDGPAGVVRFEPAADGTTISVALAAEARGRGLGTRLIAESTRRFAALSPGATVHAYIKPENGRSLAAFERAGYTVAPATTVRGQPALHRVWRCA